MIREENYKEIKIERVMELFLQQPILDAFGFGSKRHQVCIQQMKN